MAKTEIASGPESFEHALPIGTQMLGDQFTITHHLGAGGFGITYRARDNVLGREIVIKECFFEAQSYRNGKDVAPHRSSYEKSIQSIVKMFMREARSLAKLRHPNIVGVHRVFEENNTAYMVLDLIEGRDLYKIMENPPQPAEVKRILLQLLDAVDQVHRLDLLHRDISPDNILVEPSGTPVLIDFGAAKGDANPHANKATSVMVVKDGYSPYEFYEAGSEQSQSSDLYALGATFYHLLTGKAPANSQLRLLEMAGKQPDPSPPLAGRIPGYDETFLKAIDKAMQVHPKDRMQSASQWREMIADDLLAVHPPTSAPATPPQDLGADFERKLSRLVEETNEQVKIISKPRKQPEPKIAPPKARPQPDWLDEFNEETRARDTGQTSSLRSADDETTDGDSDAAPPVKGPAIQTTNWIERALEKQERSRVEFGLEEAHLETDKSEEPANAPTTDSNGAGKTPTPTNWPRVAASLVLTVSVGVIIQGIWHP